MNKSKIRMFYSDYIGIFKLKPLRPYQSTMKLNLMLNRNYKIV